MFDVFMSDLQNLALGVLGFNLLWVCWCGKTI